MATTAQRSDIVSLAEYLAREARSPLRHEFVDGRVYAMGGASDRHNIIALTLAGDLQDHLARPCQVFMADMRLRIASKAAELHYYPDVLVSCAEDDRASHHREKPCLVVEVLSPTTERTDRKEKLDAYRQIASLLEYVILDQDRVHVEIYRRRTGWQREFLGAGDAVTLESVGLATTVAAIYRRSGLLPA